MRVGYGWLEGVAPCNEWEYCGEMTGELRDGRGEGGAVSGGVRGGGTVLQRCYECVQAVCPTLAGCESRISSSLLPLAPPSPDSSLNSASAPSNALAFDCVAPLQPLRPTPVLARVFPDEPSSPSLQLDQQSVPLPSLTPRANLTTHSPPQMLGDSAQALITESSRSLQTRTLLPYSTPLVRSIIRESHSLSASITHTAAPFVGTQGVAPTPGVSAELTISALAMNRNKRALYVYHQQRLDTLRERFWEAGGVLSAAFGNATETRRNMTTVDEAFAKGYADLCLSFKTSFYAAPATNKRPYDPYGMDEDEEEDEEEEGDPTCLMDAVDVLGGGTALSPPKELMVDVRAMKDVGEVELLSGNRVNLRAGQQYFLAREDVEAMVVAGEVEIVE